VPAWQVPIWTQFFQWIGQLDLGDDDSADVQLLEAYVAELRRLSGCNGTWAREAVRRHLAG
jgi:hypothetical protein